MLIHLKSISQTIFQITAVMFYIFWRISKKNGDKNHPGKLLSLIFTTTITKKIKN